MDSNVVTIHGGRQPGEPNAFLIEDLEGLLEKVRRGEVNAVAYVAVEQDGGLTFLIEGDPGYRLPLGAGILMLQQRYVQAFTG